jgi:hypothetical protein
MEFFILHPEMKDRRAVLYVVEFYRAGESFLKVGITRTNVINRLKSGYRKYARRLIASRELSLYEAYCLEQKVLTAFKDSQVFPKQNLFVGKTECLSFSCIDALLSWLERDERTCDGARNRSEPHPETAAMSPIPVPSG